MAPGEDIIYDEASIAACWHEACPTLQTIILPKGQLWFRRDGKWTCTMVPESLIDIEAVNGDKSSDGDEPSGDGVSGPETSSFIGHIGSIH